MTTFGYGVAHGVAIITLRIDTLSIDTAFVRVTLTIIVYALTIGTAIMTFTGTLVIAIANGTSLAIFTQIIIINALGVHAILATDTIIWVVHAGASLTTLTAFTRGIAFTR